MPPRYDDELMEHRVHVFMPPSMLDDIAAWQRKQADVPNRSEAIRRLVEIGLKAK